MRVIRTKCWSCRRSVYEMREKDKTQGAYRVLVVVSSCLYSISWAAVRGVIWDPVPMATQTHPFLLLRSFLDPDASPLPTSPV